MVARILTLATVAAGLIALGGCASDYKTSRGDPESARERLEARAEQAVKDFAALDPGLQTFIDDSYGYAVFPNVGKGAVGIGGARGDGVVYRDDRVVGYATLKQGTIGLQLGGQSYSELVFFEDESAFRRFTRDELEFSAQTSAVAAAKGASADADYARGVAIFTMPLGGLMFEASVGGQQFDYQPAEAELD